MSVTIIFICNFMMRAVCFGGAAVLAYYDKAGWGWLIFAGLVTGVSYKGDGNKPKVVDNEGGEAPKREPFGSWKKDKSQSTGAMDDFSPAVSTTPERQSLPRLGSSQKQCVIMKMLFI